MTIFTTFACISKIFNALVSNKEKYVSLNLHLCSGDLAAVQACAFRGGSAGDPGAFKRDHLSHPTVGSVQPLMETAGVSCAQSSVCCTSSQHCTCTARSTTTHTSFSPFFVQINVSYESILIRSYYFS